MILYVFHYDYDSVACILSPFGEVCHRSAMFNYHPKDHLRSFRPSIGMSSPIAIEKETTTKILVS